jgi:tryptophanyl-tRNA synthetase
MSEDEFIAASWFSGESNNSPGFTAQEIDSSIISITSTGLSSTATIPVASLTSAAGINGTWQTSTSNINITSGISFTDPYEEIEKRLKSLEDTIAEEKQIRDNHPAVKNAYDEYRLLLVLAKSHLTSE